jgi:ankyrin repeat protein
MEGQGGGEAQGVTDPQKNTDTETTKIGYNNFQLFLLHTERGDLAAVRRIVTALAKKKTIFDIDCVDPLGRSGLIIAIENENLEMIQFLLESGINPKVGPHSSDQWSDPETTML